MTKTPVELNRAYVAHFKENILSFLRGEHQPNPDEKNQPSLVAETAVGSIGKFSRILDAFTDLPVLSHQQASDMSENERYAHIESLLVDVMPVLLNQDRTALHPDIIKALGPIYEDLLEGRSEPSSANEQQELEQLRERRRRAGNPEHINLRRNNEQQLAEQMLKAVVASYGQRILDTIPKVPDDFTAKINEYSEEERSRHREHSQQKIEAFNTYMRELGDLSLTTTREGLEPRELKVDPDCLGDAANSLLDLYYDAKKNYGVDLPGEMTFKDKLEEVVVCLEIGGQFPKAKTSYKESLKALNDYLHREGNEAVLEQANRPNQQGQSLLDKVRESQQTLIDRSRLIEKARRKPIIRALFGEESAIRVAYINEQVAKSGRGLLRRLRGASEKNNPSKRDEQVVRKEKQYSEQQIEEMEDAAERRASIEELNHQLQDFQDNVKGMNGKWITLDESSHYLEKSIENLRIVAREINEQYSQAGLGETGLGPLTADSHLAQLKIDISNNQDETIEILKKIGDVDLQKSQVEEELRHLSEQPGSQAGSTELGEKYDALEKDHQALIIQLQESQSKGEGLRQNHHQLAKESQIQNLAKLREFIVSNPKDVSNVEGIDRMALWRMANSSRSVVKVESPVSRPESPRGVMDDLDFGLDRRGSLETELKDMDDKVTECHLVTFDLQKITTLDELESQMQIESVAKHELMYRIEELRENQVGDEVLEVLENSVAEINERMEFFTREFEPLFHRKMEIEKEVSQLKEKESNMIQRFSEKKLDWQNAIREVSPKEEVSSQETATRNLKS
jgi:hypothetical protein